MPGQSMPRNQFSLAIHARKIEHGRSIHQAEESTDVVQLSLWRTDQFLIVHFHIAGTSAMAPCTRKPIGPPSRCTDGRFGPYRTSCSKVRGAKRVEYSPTVTDYVKDLGIRKQMPYPAQMHNVWRVLVPPTPGGWLVLACIGAIHRRDKTRVVQWQVPY